MSTDVPILKALSALGELLAAEGTEARLVIVGGAALTLLGIIRRATNDVDVIAVALPSGALAPPEPFPPALARAVRTVARDLNLPPDWMNGVVGGQWQTGLPPRLAERLEWRRFSGLWVGLPARADLIALKLYAAADQAGPDSRHMQDLVALHPSDEELAAAAVWIKETQDPTITAIVTKAINHVRAQLR